MIYVFLADGFEEIEALAPVDILRRAGVSVCTVGVTGKTVTGSHGIAVAADAEDFDPADCEGVVLPGGMPGTAHLDGSPLVARALAVAKEKGCLIAAICAAPSVLGHKGLLAGRRATCYPGWEGELTGALYTGEPVTEDGNFLTARGAGVAVEFGLALTARLVSPEKAEEIGRSIQCR